MHNPPPPMPLEPRVLLCLITLKAEFQHQEKERDERTHVLLTILMPEVRKLGSLS